MFRHADLKLRAVLLPYIGVNVKISRLWSKFSPIQIRHGEADGIIGPSGTGKSTILKTMAGHLAPDTGEVLIQGKRRHGLISDEEISGLRIGLVFQSAALFDSLTVRENVGFLLYENSSMPENKIEKLVTETLSAVGLKGLRIDYLLNCQAE